MKRRIPFLLAAILLLTSGCGQAASSPSAASSVSAEAPTFTEASAAPVSVLEQVSAPEAEQDAPAGTLITLSDDGITIDGSGAEADGSVLTIKDSGSYTITGSLSEGQILVDPPKEERVDLTLDNVTVTSSENSAFFSKKAEMLTVTLVGENTFADSGNYTDEKMDAAMYSKAPLNIIGSGSLTVNGSFDKGIHCTTVLAFGKSAQVDVTSVGDGIKSKCTLDVFEDAALTVTSEGDGIQVVQDTDNPLGEFRMAGGTVTITSQQDAVQADTAITLEGGSMNLLTGGGSVNAPAHYEGFGPPGVWFMDAQAEEDATPSAKGLKSGSTIDISGGTITMDCMDDAVHCAEALTVSGGTLEIATGDDALHSDNELLISGGTINITTSYEGIEGVFITTSGGETTLVSSDDGVNAAGGSEEDFPFRGPGMEGMAETLEDASYYFHMTGGKLVMDASGDGLDSNGALFIDGGEAYVSGPSDTMNGALDYTTTGQVNGGIVVAAGASGMAQNFDYSSTQCAFRYVFSSFLPEKTRATLTDSTGKVLVECELARPFNSIVISCPEIQVGETYTLTCGDETVEITQEDIITYAGTSGGFGGMGGPGGGPGGMGGPPPGR